MSDHDHPTPAKILETGLAFWASKTLLSAVEIGIFTELAAGPKGFEDLRGRTGLHIRPARDFFDTLVALGFLQKSGDTYSNTRETDLFLDRKKPLSHGANMTIAHKFPFRDYKTFVDVGTAQGDLAAQIALAHPHLRGVGFDLPEVAPVFEEYAAATGVADRVTFAGGSFLTEPLPKADVVLMGHILHDWDLATKKMLIAKAYDALPAGCEVVVYEAIIDDARSKNAFGLMMSLNMLIETPGGFDYTGAECAAWMREAGFRTTRVEALVRPDSMVVALK